MGWIRYDKTKGGSKERYLNMTKQERIEVEGVVLESFPDATFKIDIGAGNTVLAYVSGNLKKNKIRIMISDKVLIEMSPYDLTRGRITYRFQ